MRVRFDRFSMLDLFALFCLFSELICLSALMGPAVLDLERMEAFDSKASLQFSCVVLAIAGQIKDVSHAN